MGGNRKVPKAPKRARAKHAVEKKRRVPAAERNRGDNPSRPGPDYKIGRKQINEIRLVLMYGGTLLDACRTVGVSESAFFRTLQRDSDLAGRVEKWKQRYKNRMIRRVGSAEDWKAAAWMLERRYGKEYGKAAVEAGLEISAAQAVSVKRAVTRLLEEEGRGDLVEKACAAVDDVCLPGGMAEVELEFVEDEAERD